MGFLMKDQACQKRQTEGIHPLQVFKNNHERSCSRHFFQKGIKGMENGIKFQHFLDFAKT